MHYIIKRYKLCTIVLSLIAMSTYGQGVSETWDHKIVVTTGTEEFDGKNMYAYCTIVYDVKQSFVQNLLVKKIKERTEEKVSGKKVVTATQVRLPKLDVEAVDLIASSVAVEETDDVRVIVAFVLGDTVVNPDDFPEEDKVARDILYEFGVILNQSVVTSQIATAKVDQSTLENKQLSLTNKKKSLEQILENSRVKLKELKEGNADITAKLAEAKEKAASLKVDGDSQTSSTKDLDKYDAAIKEVSKAEAQLLKNEQSQVNANEKIKENEESLQEKNKEVEEIALQLDNQQKLIARLESKYEAIK